MFAKRILSKLNKYGEQFAIGSKTCRGFFRPLDAGTMRTYLDEVEVMGVVRPGLCLVTGGDASISLNDTISRDNRTYTVVKLYLHRIKGSVVLKTAILA